MRIRHILAAVITAGCVLFTGIAAGNPIIYSGPRNIVYSDRYYNLFPISLFDAPGTWDDMRLELEVDWFHLEFYKSSLNEGDHVEFAISSENDYMIKRLGIRQTIGPNLTYSNDPFRYFGILGTHSSGESIYNRDESIFRLFATADDDFARQPFVY